MKPQCLQDFSPPVPNALNFTRTTINSTRITPPTLVKEAAVEASFGCILRLKNAVNDEFLQDLLRKVQAAMATYHFVENCTSNMSQPYLDEIINIKLKVDLVADPIMKMVDDMHHLRNHYHQKVLPALTKAMDDFSDSKIQVQAAMATYHFVENCTSNMSQPYLDDIINIKLKVDLVADPIMKMVDDMHHLRNHYHQKVLPALTKAMDDFSDSKIQVQAAMATYHFVENCTSNMSQPYLDEIINIKLKVDLVADPIMKMVDDMHHLRNHYHQKVLPALTKAMDDFSDSKIQVQAAMATYHFVENCTSNMSQPYLDEIINIKLKVDLVADPIMKMVDDMHHLRNHYHQKVLPALTKAMDDFSDSKIQVQAAMATYHFVENCTSNMSQPYLDEIINIKLKVDLVADPIMKMVDDMHHLRNHYHQKVLPALTKAMDDFSDSKIQVQAAMATYHFVENCTSNMSQPYLDEIISKLLRCLQVQAAMATYHFVENCTSNMSQPYLDEIINIKLKVDLVADPIMKMVDDMHHLRNHYHQKVLPALTKAMDDFSDSKIQVQAAMATYHFVENCTSNMSQPYLDEIINIKLKVDLVADPIMKMVDDMHHLRNHYHQKVLPALTKAMDDFSDSKIQVQAAMATYHFVENCTSNMSQPYLDEIISKLLRCLQTPLPRLVDLDSDVEPLTLPTAALMS
uniref:Uncharacterized protein n=1 Tax=Salix viminalis TaxID=40686 RepID=A0A6N2M137_SALVM